MLDAPPGNETVPEDIRLQSTVDLIEIKNTYDLLIHERVTDAIAQHAQLRQNLLDAGWGTVNIYPFIVGNAGTIRKASHTDPRVRDAWYACRVEFICNGGRCGVCFFSKAVYCFIASHD